MKRALVTGGAGLIGSHVADLLFAKAGRFASSTTSSRRRIANGDQPWI